MFEHLTAVLPAERVTHLDRVHRFVNEWEAAASLKLRHGDAAGLDPYFANGRCVNVETPPEALSVIRSLWSRHESAGEDFAIFCARNELVDVINGEIQTHRRNAGLASDRKTIAGRSHQLGVGDHIVARQNDRAIVTDRDRWVRNRDRFTITSVSDDGLRAIGPTGSVVLPADYVKAQVELAYAQTSHAGQGRTVDHSLLLIDQSDTLDRAGVYVPMTRGRASNRVLSMSGSDPSPNYLADKLTAALQRRWIDTPALAELGIHGAKKQVVAGQALIDHIGARMTRTRKNRTARFHPLLDARMNRLKKQQDKAWAEMLKPLTDRHRAPASEPKAPRRSLPTRPDRSQEGPDLGLDL